MHSFPLVTHASCMHVFVYNPVPARPAFGFTVKFVNNNTLDLPLLILTLHGAWHDAVLCIFLNVQLPS